LPTPTALHHHPSPLVITRHRPSTDQLLFRPPSGCHVKQVDFSVNGFFKSHVKSTN